jgi:hypothetical protein
VIFLKVMEREIQEKKKAVGSRLDSVSGTVANLGNVDD